MDVVALFGLRGIQHTPISIKNARVSQVCLGKGIRDRYLVPFPASNLMCPIPYPALQGQPHCHFQPVSGEYHGYLGSVKRNYVMEKTLPLPGLVLLI